MLLYVQIFYFTDRAAHVFWRLYDPDHPAYDAKLTQEYGEFILGSYQWMDQAVGKALAALPEDSVLLLCSDRGFSPWYCSLEH